MQNCSNSKELRHKSLKICKQSLNWARGFKNKAKNPIFDMEQPIASQSALSKKVAFFQKDQLDIGPVWRILEEMGQKLILEPLCSKI